MSNLSGFVVKGHFPADLASSETADLFMSVIMYRLKKKLLSEFNLHTVEEEILAPIDLIQRYQEERSSLNAEIDRVLSEIMEKLKGN